MRKLRRSIFIVLACMKHMISSSSSKLKSKFILLFSAIKVIISFSIELLFWHLGTVYTTSNFGTRTIFIRTRTTYLHKLARANLVRVYEFYPCRIPKIEGSVSPSKLSNFSCILLLQIILRPSKKNSRFLISARIRK